METIVIYYSNRDMTMTPKILGHCFELDGKRILFHRTGFETYSISKTVVNYDINLEVEMGSGAPLSFESANNALECKLSRLTKMDQQSLLRTYYDNRPTKSKFIYIPTYNAQCYNLNVDSTSVSEYLYDDRFVMKPDTGSRGIGMVTIPCKSNMLSSACNVINNILMESNQDVEELIIECNYGYHSNREFKEYEGIEQLKNSRLVQNQVKGIVREYRIITDAYSEVAFSSLRTLTDDPVLPQAVIGESSGNGVSIEEKETETLVSDIKQVISGLNIPINSVDIFITESGHWGIFEFQPEHDNLGIDSIVLEDIHKGFIRRLIKEIEKCRTN